MSSMKAEFQKYLDKLKGVDLTPKSSELASKASTVVNNISSCKSAISSSSWTELGEESLANSTIPSIQNYTSSLSSNIGILNQATSKAKELVTILEDLKKACDEYDNLNREDYAYYDSEGNKKYHDDQYNAKKEQLKKAYEALEDKARSKISEINGLSVASISMNITSLFATESASATTLDNLALKGGGQFVADSSRGIYGYIVSSMDGKRHIIFRQSQIDGWGQNCNRAAAASIASAFTNNAWDAVTAADQVGGGIGYVDGKTTKYFAKFGLTATVRTVNGSYNKIQNDIVTNLSKGNYVMFDLDDPHVVGRSGQQWTSTRHWLALLDIKKTGSGPNDYAVFVSDSGHKGSTKDHGLGTGWYSIDEFAGQKVKNLTIVKNTSRKT